MIAPIVARYLGSDPVIASRKVPVRPGSAETVDKAPFIAYELAGFTSIKSLSGCQTGAHEGSIRFYVQAPTEAEANELAQIVIDRLDGARPEVADGDAYKVGRLSLQDLEEATVPPDGDEQRRPIYVSTLTFEASARRL